MIQLHNTLSGKKEIFTPIEKGFVKMYSCGPTVYNYAHIGNLRAYIFVDVLRRTLKYNGLSVKHVMNVTDVGHLTNDSDDGDDKMVRALKRDGKPFTLAGMREVADFYAKAFVDDLKSLNCELPDKMPFASEHIAEDIELISKLEEKGFAYKTNDGMYFNTSRFPNYGKLGNINIEGQLAGARIAINSEKKNSADFTLWKKSSNDLGWESPWGRGFPGWHIECSAMSRKFLGQPFDIHTGGIDHVPIHHNNEIAQSEAAYDVPLANYWLHNEHLNVPSGKMAKSGDNFITLKKLSELEISSLAYRYFVLLAGYRTPISFHENIVKKVAVTSLDRIYRALATLPDGGVVNKNYASEFLDAVNNDLNTAEGLSLVYKVLGDTRLDPANKLATILDFDRVLGLKLKEGRLNIFAVSSLAIPEEIQKLVLERRMARETRDWKKSDELRDLIQSKGFKVIDTDSSSTVEPF